MNKIPPVILPVVFFDFALNVTVVPEIVYESQESFAKATLNTVLLFIYAQKLLKFKCLLFWMNDSVFCPIANFYGQVVVIGGDFYSVFG